MAAGILLTGPTLRGWQQFDVPPIPSAYRLSLSRLAATAPGMIELMNLRGDPVRAAAAIADFRDDLGHRRRVDAPILHHLLKVAPPLAPDGPGLRESDEQLWWGITLAHFDPARVLQGGWEGSGPLTGDATLAAIETATQTELSALHALWHHVQQTTDPRRRQKRLRRLVSAAEWCIASIQPDNATNHPWAIPVFLHMASQLGQGDAAIYAEVLVHNCLVARGRPDRFSALLLWDASEAVWEA